MGDSNPRPRQCECRALSAELMPRLLNYILFGDFLQSFNFNTIPTLTPQVQHFETYRLRVESSTRVFFLVYCLLNLLSLLYLV